MLGGWTTDAQLIAGLAAAKVLVEEVKPVLFANGPACDRLAAGTTTDTCP